MSVLLNSNEQKIALLKKLKQILTQQREKFHQYLVVLEAEKKSIENDLVESLEEQLKMEENLILDIQSFQKVILGLQTIAQQSYSDHQDQEVEILQTSLETLRQQVLEKNKTNRQLLSARMSQIQSEIRQLQPRFGAKNLFGFSSQTSSLVDITT